MKKLHLQKALIKTKITFLFLSVCITVCFAQGPVPADYLTKDFHKGRRDALRKLLPANSVMAIFAYPVRNFSNDVDYKYHPNPDLYYFSGYTEPNSVLLIFKENQKDSAGQAYNELFLYRKKMREESNGPEKDLELKV